MFINACCDLCMMGIHKCTACSHLSPSHCSALSENYSSTNLHLMVFLLSSYVLHTGYVCFDLTIFMMDRWMMMMDDVQTSAKHP